MVAMAMLAMNRCIVVITVFEREILVVEKDGGRGDELPEWSERSGWSETKGCRQGGRVGRLCGVGDTG